MRSPYWCSLLFLLALVSTGAAEDRGPVAGPTETGYLLPNGWHLTPVGKHFVTTDMPLNVIPLADGKRALIATSGYNRHNLYLVDIGGDEPQSLATASSRQSWYGLAIDKSEGKVWWSGGGYGELHSFDLNNGGFTRTSAPESRPGRGKKANADGPKAGDAPASDTKSFRSGVALDEAAGLLYSLDINAGELHAIRLADGSKNTLPTGGRPYDVVVGPKQLFVSDWAGDQILVIDPAGFRVVAKIPVGDHPNQMVLHKDGRLFVACSASNTVSVIDTKRGQVVETIFTALFPKAPEGSTPDALALAPDGDTLYVANADNNCIAVIDVETPRQSGVKGFIPTGWYPTAVAVTPDGKNLLVGVGKGLRSHPNPRKEEGETLDSEGKPLKGRAGRPYPYIGTLMSGALTVLPVPDETTLKDYTAKVYQNCPYSDEQLTVAPHPVRTAIPTRVGDASPIKHVIYIIKENRTYDQVFGDLASGPDPKGNGDPSLCMFPRKVTPNHHKLAEEFVLLDNLYCNGQVSRDGHPWSTMAYNTDYIARDWHLTYSKREGVDDDDEGHLQNAPSGYLWDACARAGLSYRAYGEYGKRVSDGQGALKMEGRVPGLIGHLCPEYGIPKVAGQKNRDTDNAEVFIAEYDKFAKEGTMPRFIIMSLGEDHTSGTTVGAFTPEACVASNDLALGRIVEHVSHGPLWKETAIFVIEDDAQNGPDHVDAQRTVGLVISPYTKRKVVDSTLYSTVSLIRTMELILGLEPLSQYDAAARPMFNSFTDQEDLTPYTHEAARMDLEAKNTELSYGAERSNKMDFSEYDRIDDFELNEILWHAVMGKDAPTPPAVRHAIAFRSLPTAK
ncbi:bifunctional YncE family protein/alkaline phosphatase family protein [Luteolibacter luteus]|uniref:Beta-propeller fold lactonase family protein n=1 Tax=Luteolibacter luteus TaxID=2728835 RepID=A0A858RP43_9BACT|nr:alkaline phosphatase family protein [Luteolibacter luteus]QJE97900.1 beta-propeller fold lactonase family protein [Luteolibacter luteus]